MWFKDRFFYISIDGTHSTMFKILLGAVQGSILAPILYAILVAPLFDLETFSAFADATFIAIIEHSLTKLINDMEKSLKAITK